MDTTNLQSTALTLYSASTNIFWQALPLALLLSIAGVYLSGEISGAKLESIFRKLLISIVLVVAFPEISSAIQSLEKGLCDAFGGDAMIDQVFARISDRAHEIKESGSFNWLKIGQMGLSIISTISFLVLSVVRRFLDVLHLCIWNLLNILGPMALLGCMSQTFVSVPKGIFMGLLELSLWKPVWVILCQILIAIGFSETPASVSDWFNTAIMNFAVAGLMASTPMLVHGLLSGSLGSIGGSVMQTMLAGAGGAMARVPMNIAQTPVRAVKTYAKAKFKAAFKERPQQNTNNTNFKNKRG